ncbi:hypothetical protein [uncultured Aquimarina sp.]|uniref:hypothetical protein n=1 Tax=uncultured Aquimarina sp. TaxID=575652 RepID=UPI002619A2BB|nr:hypothetical protein [uncultured Aquimarina sp.]
MKTVKKNVRWSRKLKNKKFENMNFEELTVYSKKIKSCEFFKVDFKHSSLGSGTIYKNCKFIKCKFSGKYTSLGNSTDYINCTFEDCTFQGTMIFIGPIFKNCWLSGKMKNNILVNEKRFLKKPYKFDNCNLTEVEFYNITFNGNRFFKSCKLPRSSIRLFKNDNDELVNYVIDQIENLDDKIKNDLLIIFDKKLRTGFNPFVIDTALLEDLLKESGTTEFEKIVKEFEIKSS